MGFTIAEDLLVATRLTEQEMAMEIAVLLHQHGDLPVSAAAGVARMGRTQFQHLLASRNIPVDWTDCTDLPERGIDGRVIRGDDLKAGDGLGPAIIPDDVLRAANLSQAELATELAIVLYQREKLSLGRAAEVAGMNKWAFNHLLADREIPMHYDERDLQRDLATLRTLVGR